MFVQSRVVYIIKNFAGQPKKIIDDLIQNNIFKYFFDDINIITNRNFIRHIASLPKNTVFCINVSYNPTSRKTTKNSNIAIPFISSHVNFPVKIGEIVWFYSYEFAEGDLPKVETYNIDGYYLGRVHSLLNTEDSSYCFHDREIITFSRDKLTPNESAKKQKSKGILEILEFNEEFIPSTTDMIEEPTLDIITDISKNILNNSYYYTELANYNFNPTNSTSSSPEDVLLKGSHNTLFELGSCKNSEGPTVTGGKVKIVAGNNVRLRSQSLSDEKSLLVRETDNTSPSDFIDVKIFDNGVEAIVDNSIFYETIKTTNQFVNPDTISNDIKRGIVHNTKNDIKDNSSTFVISQYGFENKQETQNINFSIPIVYDEVLENVETFNSVKINLPVSENLNNFTNDDNSSIVGLSDSITLKTHENSNGAITLISPIAGESYQNYITLKQDNIHINAKKIVIGDAKRQKDLASGYNASLFLGFSNDMQSLVLGEQLNVFLRDLIDVQKESINTIKDLFKDSKQTDNYIKEALKNIQNALNETNTGLTTLGSALGVPANAGLASQIPNVNSSISNIDIKKYEENIVKFKANRDEMLFEKLTQISDSLDLILSKFVKSSWVV